MLFAIKSFDPELASIGDRSMLTRNLSAVSSVEENVKLGTILVCLSVILRHSGSKIIVPEEVYDLLREICPFAALQKSADSEDVIVISEINTTISENFHEGEVIMPVYVPRESTVVYNIYPAEALPKIYTPDLISGALNCFNMYIRDNTAGTTRIVWKDPVAEETKYENASFDFMFALYIADGYLRVIDPEYPYETRLYNLALCENTVKLFSSRSSEKVTIWDLTPQMETEFQIPWLRPSDYGEVSAEVAALTISPEFDEDPLKRRLFPVLFLIAQQGLKTSSAFTLLVVGSKVFDHLELIASMFKECEIIVLSGTKEAVPEVLKQVTAAVTPANINAQVNRLQPTLLVSDLAVNSVIYKSFSGTSMLAPYTSLLYRPLISFLSCFAQASSKNIPGYFIMGTTKVPLEPTNKALASHKASFQIALRKLNIMFRNTKKWKYRLPGQTTVMSYDNACMQVIINHLGT